jgi:hypothetical protein
MLVACMLQLATHFDQKRLIILPQLFGELVKLGWGEPKRPICARLLLF